MLLRNKRPLIGITFSIVSVFLGLASGLLIKKVSIEANLITTLFYRFVFSVPLLLLFAVYTSRHIKYITSIYSALDKNYVDLINKISIILCICLMLILVFWLNPYTNPIEIYY